MNCPLLLVELSILPLPSVMAGTVRGTEAGATGAAFLGSWPCHSPGRGGATAGALMPAAGNSPGLGIWAHVTWPKAMRRTIRRAVGMMGGVASRLQGMWGSRMSLPRAISMPCI